MRKLLFSVFATAVIFGSGTLKAQTILFEDSFETYADFEITNVGSWTLNDVDRLDTYGFNGVTFPNTLVAKSFQVFNSTTTTPPLTPSATSNWTARTGSKVMVCFAAVEAPWNDDWLISPQVGITAGLGAKLSFWAKGCDATYGAEKFKVLVSTTGTAPSDFTAITPVIVTPSDAAWHEYTYSLNAYSGQQIHVAIQCTSEDQFGFAVDDFKIVTNALPTAAPGCATLTSPANTATNVAYVSQTLSWTAPTTGDAAESYDVYLDKTANPTTLVGNTASTSFTVTNLDAASVYYWRVVPKNTAGSATGCSVFSFTTAAGTYCSAGATSTLFEKISNVTFADINNNSTSTAGYEDFTQVVGNVTAGSTYTFSANFSGSSYEDDQVLVWIDFNNDQDFNDPGEQVLVTPTQVAPWTGSITIPADAVGGTTRMRVRLHDSVLTPNLTPCGTSSFGQVEDYTLNVVTLAVNENIKNGVKVYPNPVVDFMNIESPVKVKSATVYDVSGKSVSTHELNAAKSQINLSKLNPGVYMVRLETEGGVKTVKVIKK